MDRMAEKKQGTKMSRGVAVSNWVDGGAIKKRKMREHHWVGMVRGIKISLEFKFLLKVKHDCKERPRRTASCDFYGKAEG